MLLCTPDLPLQHTMSRRAVLKAWHLMGVLREQYGAAAKCLLQAASGRRLLRRSLLAWGKVAQLERLRRDNWPQMCRCACMCWCAGYRAIRQRRAQGVGLPIMVRVEWFHTLLC